jgi:hypothetical protein
MRRNVLGRRTRGLVVLLALCAPILAPGAADASRASAPIGGGAIGVIDQIERVPGGLRVVGWALDQDVVDPIDVHVYADGSGIATTASLPRPDVAAAYPGYGPNHGFAVTVPTSGGLRNVCAYAISVGDGGYNPGLGCYLVQVSSTPFGFIDQIVRVPGGLRVTGWALDQDVVDPIDVHVYADGSGIATTASLPRPDVAAAYPGYGPNHGFAVTVPTFEGLRNVCAYAISVGDSGDNGGLGCYLVPVSSTPFGFVDRIHQVPGAVQVDGWAIDPDTAAAIEVHGYVGRSGAPTNANLARPDVANVLPDYGPAHGFSVAAPVAAGGVQDICAYGIDTRLTSPVGVLGCQPFDVQVSPWGAVDVVNLTASFGRGFRVRGWAIDPSTGESLDVRIVWLDARPWMPWHDAGIARADTPRPDLLAHFPEWGPDHGFDVTVADAAWNVYVDVCVYAVNKGPGDHVLLGCKGNEAPPPST